MAWVYLDDQFPDHPKVVAAGDAAAWMFVCGLAYARRYNTEGRIPKAQVPKLTGTRSTNKLVAALLHAPAGFEHGLWEDRGDHYYIHDYTQWNKPQASRSEAARTAAEARWKKEGRKGNRKAKPDASAMRDALPDASVSDADPDASGCPPPLPNDYNQSSDYSHNGGDPPDDDHDQQQPPDQQARVGAAVAVLAQQDLTARQQAPDQERIFDVTAWLNKAYDARHQADGPALAELAQAHPDLDAEGLAALLTPAATSTDPPPARNGTPSPHDETLVAQMSRAEANMRQLRAERVQVETTGRGPQAARQALRSPGPGDPPATDARTNP